MNAVFNLSLITVFSAIIAYTPPALANNAVDKNHAQTAPGTTSETSHTEAPNLEATVQALTLRQQKLEKIVAALQEKNQLLTKILSDSGSFDQQALDTLNAKVIPSVYEPESRRHQALVKQHQLLQTEMDIIKAENERLADSNHHTWFAYGAAAVGLGVLITLFIPMVWSQRRRNISEWS